MLDSKQIDNRRPLQSRGRAIFHKLAALLTKAGITPNAVSLFGLLMAVLGAELLLKVAEVHDTAKAIFLIGGAVCIQLRLLCNILDRLIAVQNKKASKVGVLYHEVPDRFEDCILFIAAGYTVSHGSSLYTFTYLFGFSCALLAILTAYIRLLGGSLGQTQIFVGPSAKHQRMILLTITCLAASAAAFIRTDIAPFVCLGLALIALLTLATFLRRLRLIAKEIVK